MELSEEEIEAIEKVKEAIRVDKEQRIVTIYDEKPLFRDRLQTLIDLLNKQQDKIVDLETKLAIKTIDNKYIQEERDEETIPRFKIREKIKELEKFDDGYNEDGQPELNWVVIEKINLLEELLEENDE